MLCNVGVVFNAYYIILTYYNITRRLAISKVALCSMLSVNGCGVLKLSEGEITENILIFDDYFKEYEMLFRRLQISRGP